MSVPEEAKVAGNGSCPEVCIGIADDDRAMVRLLARNLQAAGYRVVSAVDGLGALRLVEQENPEVLILDIAMPCMDGYTVLARLRGFTWVPVMLLPAWTTIWSVASKPGQTTT
jgi:two-component system KDP operon response regulator KdpE